MTNKEKLWGFVTALAMTAVTTVPAHAASAVQEPVLDLLPGTFNEAGILAPEEASDPFELVIPGGGTVEIGVPSETGDGEPTLGGGVIYEDADIDVAFEAVALDVTDEPVLASGLQILTHIDGPEAPKSYRYDIVVPDGATLDPREDGSVELLDADGEILGIFAEPWAVDADGQWIQTWYELDGDALVQHLWFDAREVTYPVVADPAFLVPIAISVGARIVTAHVVRVAATRAAATAAAQAMTLRAVSVTVAQTALRNYSTLSFRTGAHTFRLDKSGMQHVLTRHHPTYWTGTTTGTQTFFDPRLTTSGVRDLAHRMMKANSERLLNGGTNSSLILNARLDGISYKMTIVNGRVVQFFPTGG